VNEILRRTSNSILELKGYHWQYEKRIEISGELQ